MYPRWKYNTEGDSVLIKSAADEPSGEWFDTPLEAGIITCPSVEQELGIVPVPEKRKAGRPKKQE